MNSKNDRDLRRRLILKGISHDYKRVLASLEQLSREISQTQPLASHPDVSRRYRLLRDEIIDLSDELDRVGNDIEVDLTTPITTILSNANSRLNHLCDRVVSDTELFCNIVHLLSPSLSQISIDNSKLRKLARRARAQIKTLLNMPFQKDLSPKLFSIRGEIRRILLDLYAIFSEYNCDPAKIVIVDVHSYLHVDQTMFTIAVANIIVNAIVHSDHRDLLSIRISEAPATQTRHFDARGHLTEETAVELIIADNGPGIPAEEQEAIFQLFRQGSKAAASDIGSGVGLSFAKLAMEMSGGAIRLRSAPGEGAAFSLIFKQVREER